MASEKVHVVNHAVIKDALGYLRNRKTSLADFRMHSDRVCAMLFAEAIRDLKLESRQVETPLAVTVVEGIDGKVVVIPILRAGIAMVQGALQSIPTARLGFVGLRRNEETAVAEEYYWNVPEVPVNGIYIITDPMLATGGSADHVATRMESLSNARGKLVCVIAAPGGIQRMQEKHPNLEIYTGAIDERLNDRAYIVPGLGDYGDLYAGTY